MLPVDAEDQAKMFERCMHRKQEDLAEELKKFQEDINGVDDFFEDTHLLLHTMDENTADVAGNLIVLAKSAN